MIFKLYDYIVKQKKHFLFLLFLLILSLNFTAAVSAQDINSSKISVNFSGKKLLELIPELEKITGMRFEYQHNLFENNNPVITLKVEQQTVAAVLNKLFAGTALTYKQAGNSILIIARPVPVRKAQSGKVSGKITDSEDGSAIAGASIRIGGKGTSTDTAGVYNFNFPAGNYSAEVSSVGYGSKKITGILVTENKAFILNIPLTKDKGQLNQVTVSARRVQETGTNAAIVDEIKNADAVVSGISKEQISRSQDRDAAEVVRRIPSVSVMQNRFIIVRGLPQRYNSVLLNGVTAPSFEADSRAFSFDIMPSSMIDRILVYKTAVPELPGDFAGGVVKVYTTGMPVKNAFNVSYQSSFRQGTTLSSFYQQPQGSKSWLGYDDGTYALPKAFKEARNLEGRIDLLPVKDRRPLTKTFNQNWDAGQQTAPLDTRLNMDLARRFYLGKNTQFGLVSALSYTNSYRYQVISRNTGKFAGGENKFTREYTFADQSYEHDVRVNGLLNLSLNINADHQIEFKNLYTHLGSSTFVDRAGLAGEEASDSDEGYLAQKVLLNNYRGTYLGQLTGTHKFFNKKTEIDWLVSYNQTRYNDPDQRSREFSVDPAKYYGTYSLLERNLDRNIVSAANRGRQYINLPDTSRTAGLNVVQNFEFSGFKPQLKAGIFIEDKDRTFEFIQLGYLSDDPKYGPGQVIGETYGRQNSYTASNLLQAGYLAAEIPLGSLKISGGVRVEKNRQQLHTFAYQTTGELANSKIDLDRKHTSVLPSLNISYNLNESSLIRSAYSKTLNRPEFREIASFFYKDYYTGRLAYGNPDLKTQTDIDNLDVRFEHYPGLGEMISIGAFYKKFKNPIEFYYYAGTSSRNNFQWGNAESAKSYGAELEFILGMQRFFSEENWLNRQMQKISVLFNATYVYSRVNLGARAGLQDKNRPMYGQSPYLINSAVNYTNDDSGLKMTVAYNVIGKRLFGIGNIDYPNIYELPQNLLDFSFSKKLSKTWELKGGVQNILNARSLQMQDINGDGKYKVTEGAFDSVDNRYQSAYQGTYYTLGVGIRL